MSPGEQELLQRTRRLMRTMRRATYDRDDVLEGPVTKPFLFHTPNLCGDYAVIVLGSRRCSKYTAGNCTPCHYSGLPHPRALSQEGLRKGLLAQADHLVENFDELVLKHQRGDGHGYRLPRRFPQGCFADFELAGEGSFLADSEIPPEVRRSILEKVTKLSERRKMDLHIGLEVKAEDVLRAEQRGELASWESLRQLLNLSLLMGYESRDDTVRELLFAKGLAIGDLERAISIAHRQALRPVCFVYAGAHTLTEEVMVGDVRASITWLRSRGAGVYLMLANLQPHTLPHLLHQDGRYRMMDIRTALRLVEVTIAGGEGDSPVHFHAGQDWNIGGLSAEPNPELTVFGNPHGSSCARCRQQAQEAVLQLVRSRETAPFHHQVSIIRSCDAGCEARYLRHREQQLEHSERPLLERVADNLAHAERAINGYRPQHAAIHTGPGSS